MRLIFAGLVAASLCSCVVRDAPEPPPLVRADSLWSSGERDGAVSIYRSMLDEDAIRPEDRDRRDEVYGRVIHHLVAGREFAAARKYAEDAYRGGVAVNTADRAVQVLLTQIREEDARQRAAVEKAERDRKEVIRLREENERHRVREEREAKEREAALREKWKREREAAERKRREDVVAKKAAERKAFLNRPLPPLRVTAMKSGESYEIDGGSSNTWGRVVQVTGDNSMLVGIDNGQGNPGGVPRYSVTVLCRFPTANVTDGQTGFLGNILKADRVTVTGTTRYRTVLGGTRTVFVLEPFGR